MSASPTVTNPRSGDKAERGAHWVDGSGKSFKNPWPSFQDRVSGFVDGQHAWRYAQAAVFLVIGLGMYNLLTTCVLS
jgi:hypothetical protein